MLILIMNLMFAFTEKINFSSIFKKSKESPQELTSNYQYLRCIIFQESSWKFKTVCLKENS